MGREAICVCRLGAQSGEVKALLEAHHLILRGAFKRTYAICDLRDVSASASADALCFQVGAENVELELGVEQVLRWAKKISMPPRPLVAKLGLSAENKAFVIGQPNDEALAAALAGVSTEDTEEACVTVAIAHSEIELAAAQAIHARLTRSRHLWIVHPKGRAASLADGGVRQLMRSLGYVDNKSCAVSDALTAIRYSKR